MPLVEDVVERVGTELHLARQAGVGRTVLVGAAVAVVPERREVVRDPFRGGPARLGAHPRQPPGRRPRSPSGSSSGPAPSAASPPRSHSSGDSIRIRVPEKSKRTPVIAIRRILSATGHGRQEATVLA